MAKQFVLKNRAETEMGVDFFSIYLLRDSKACLVLRHFSQSSVIQAREITELSKLSKLSKLSSGSYVFRQTGP